ncbi:hypothetical protein C4580_02025 [Candidatus Woesearchaeota archaeon]|nr:MAG: hypothetical protein C4580_02025 [Candidatus Woesearchaeota archaeon]
MAKNSPQRRWRFSNYTISCMLIGAGIYAILGKLHPTLISENALTFTIGLGIIGAITAQNALRQMER